MMRISIISVVFGLLGLVAVGCAGLGWPQQARFQAGEPATRLIIIPHGSFTSSASMIVTPRRDGTLSLHPIVSGPGEKWAHQSASPNDVVLHHLREALIPFLTPACNAKF